MTEPRNPADLPDAGTTPPAGDPAPAATPAAAPPAVDPLLASSAGDSAESPTQAWPSLTGPSDTPSGPPTPSSPFEPAESLPATRVGTVGETGTFGAGAPAAPRRGGNGLRWGLAIVGVLIVAAASFAIVSLVGGRPTTSTAMGYMPGSIVTYSEVRLDLPGDQRTKLASFLKAFPGFSDQSQIEPKLNELLDRVVKAATHDKQTWTADIKPWFGGQIAVGAGVPDSAIAANNSAAAANSTLAVLTVTDRAKAIAWVLKTGDQASINRSTYGDSDLLVPAGGGQFAIAVNDKVMLLGTTVAVKAAVDSGGKGSFDQNDDVKAALGTLEKDYVVFAVVRTRALADSFVKLMATAQPGVLDNTQLDETILGMVPAWQASTGRFENDAVVMTSVSPAWSIGYDTANRASDLIGHLPTKTIFYSDVHDAGPALTAVVNKFRALPELKSQFSQFDQAMSLLGGADAVYGWWGDTAVAVSSLDDGTIGGGLLIHPRDAAAADRLLTTLAGFVALGGGSSGITTRTEDHNGTKVTIVDFSAATGGATLPPGYKAELAWASNADVTVIGYGSSFVSAVLDAGPGKSLASDERFKGLLGRVGADNFGSTFVDLAAIRALLEPLAQTNLPPEAWTHYTTEIQPYLKPLDAIVSNVRRDGGNDRGTFVFTAH